MTYPGREASDPHELAGPARRGELMREAHPIEKTVGMAYYASGHDGTGGTLRARPEDFRVRELERFDTRPLGADPDAYPYLVCRVTLRGWDTNDFARELSNRLEMSRERIDWAGTKDKRAVSTQLVSIQGPDLEASDLPDIADAEIEVLGRSGRGLRFGDLAGNGFEVVVSQPERPENATRVTAALQALGGINAADGRDAGTGEARSLASEDGSTASEAGTAGDDMLAGNDEGTETAGSVPIGVPNYFGQQRFGSRRPVTHAVGLAIVRGKWEDAVMEYVGNPRDTEPTDTQDARRFVEETRDWKTATEKFPGGLRYERAICQRLAERGRENGKERDTRNGRNGTSRGPPNPDERERGAEDFRAALDALPRNLQRLFVNAAQSYLFNRIVSERLDRELPLDRAVEGDVVCFADQEAPDGLFLPDVSRAQRVDEKRVSVVNRHCARGRAFVTAPLVGTDTEFSGGEPGDIERAILADEGISRNDFDLPEPYYSTGTRRAVLCRTAIDVTDNPLQFCFRLPKGSYATTLLREYLKVPPTALG